MKRRHLLAAAIGAAFSPRAAREDSFAQFVDGLVRQVSAATDLPVSALLAPVPNWDGQPWRFGTRNETAAQAGARIYAELEAEWNRMEEREEFVCTGLLLGIQQEWAASLTMLRNG